MPLLARIDGVTLSGTAQVVHSQSLGGVFVEEVFVTNASGANPVTNVTVKERPYAGGPAVPVGSIVASLAAGEASGIAVGKHVEHLDVEATQGAGGNTVDVAVTSAAGR